MTRCARYFMTWPQYLHFKYPEGLTRLPSIQPIAVPGVPHTEPPMIAPMVPPTRVFTTPVADS